MAYATIIIHTMTHAYVLRLVFLNIFIASQYHQLLTCLRQMVLLIVGQIVLLLVIV